MVIQIDDAQTQSVKKSNLKNFSIVHSQSLNKVTDSTVFWLKCVDIYLVQ